MINKVRDDFKERFKNDIREAMIGLLKTDSDFLHEVIAIFESHKRRLK